MTSLKPSACASNKLTEKYPVAEWIENELSGSAGASGASSDVAHAIGTEVAAGSRATSVPAELVQLLHPSSQRMVAFQWVSLVLEAAPRARRDWVGSTAG